MLRNIAVALFAGGPSVSSDAVAILLEGIAGVFFWRYFYNTFCVGCTYIFSSMPGPGLPVSSGDTRAVFRYALLLTTGLDF